MAQSTHSFGRTILLSVFATLCLSWSGSAIAQAQDNSDSESEHVVDSGDYTDLKFLAAETLELKLTSSDDVFAAADELIVSGAAADHLIAAGGDIVARAFTIHDLILAGGDVRISSGTVQDDLIIAANEITLDTALVVGGSAVLVASEIDVDAAIGGGLKAVGEEINLRADIVGDVELYAESVTVGPGVTVGGDLRYRSESFTLDPTASVKGAVAQLTPDHSPEVFEVYGRKAVAMMALAGLIILGGILLSVVAIAALFPGLLNRSEQMMQLKPLQTFGAGALAVLAGPVLLMVLMSSMIGIPLALIVVAFYLATIPLAYAVVAYYLGLTARSILARKSDPVPPPNLLARIGWSAIGIIALIALGFIPFLGLLLWVLALMFGLGAVIVQIGRFMTQSMRITDMPSAPNLA